MAIDDGDLLTYYNATKARSQCITTTSHYNYANASMQNSSSDIDGRRSTARVFAWKTIFTYALISRANNNINTNSVSSSDQPRTLLLIQAISIAINTSLISSLIFVVRL